MDKRYVVKISGGEYSDYWEHWYWSERPLTANELADLLDQHTAEASVTLEQRNKERLDECEQLFGMRECPYYGSFRGKKGTLEEFEAWRDKWNDKACFETILLELCGLVRIEPDLSVDVGYASLWDANSVRRFTKAVRTGEAY